MDTDSRIDITPKDSVSPVFIEKQTEDEIRAIEEFQNADIVIITEEELQKIELKKSAIKKLQAMGLTEQEAKAIAGV
jgi:hypothetical protein